MLSVNLTRLLFKLFQLSEACGLTYLPVDNFHILLEIASKPFFKVMPYIDEAFDASYISKLSRNPFVCLFAVLGNKFREGVLRPFLLIRHLLALLRHPRGQLLKELLSESAAFNLDYSLEATHHHWNLMVVYCLNIFHGHS